MGLAGVVLIILFHSFNVQVQDIPSKNRTSGYFTKVEMLEDITVLRDILNEVHPSLYSYNTPDEIDKYFDDLAKDIPDRQTEREFYRNTLELISKINCGHTWLDASRGLADSLWRNIEDFPLKVRIIKGRLFYSGNSIRHSLKKGNEITEINGIPSKDLIQSFLKFTVGDGFIETGRIRMVERRFGFYFALLYDSSSTYEVTYLNEFQKISQVTLPSGSVSQAISAKNNLDIANIHLSTIDSTTAKLKINSFSDRTGGNKSFSFKTELKEAFQEINKRKFENLIIDLRDNRGGSDTNGLALLSYLVSDSIMPFRKMYSKTIGSPLLQTYSDLDDEVYEGLPQITTKTNDTTYVYCRQIWMRLLESNLPESTAASPCDQPFPPANPTFSGNLHLLINGNTFSTAADVCSILFSEGLATFFGEETGGGYHGNTSGITATVTLPNSGFRLKLPLIRYETNVRKKFPDGRGVIPQYHFSETIQSLKTEDDEMLNYAIKIIKEQR